MIVLLVIRNLSLYLINCSCWCCCYYCCCFICILFCRYRWTYLFHHSGRRRRRIQWKNSLAELESQGRWILVQEGRVPHYKNDDMPRECRAFVYKVSKNWVPKEILNWNPPYSLSYWVYLMLLVVQRIRNCIETASPKTDVFFKLSAAPLLMQNK